jgi:hypothetical protein
VKGSVVAEVYPFHEAARSDDNGHNFFWQVYGEEENPTSFDQCPLEVLMELTPAATPEAYKWRRECARNFPPHVFPLLYKRLQLVFPAEGENWRLRSSVERSSFIAEAGLEGVIEEAGERLISHLREVHQSMKGRNICHITLIPSKRDGTRVGNITTSQLVSHIAHYSSSA